MERLTTGELFDRAALGMGEREAVVFPAQAVRWKYREFHARVTQLAKGLMGLGVEAGDHVGIFATNRVEWTLVQLAVAKVGAILVPIDPTAGAAELAHVLAHSDASTLFLVDAVDGVSFYDVLAECCPELANARPGHLASRRFPMLKRVVFLDEDAAHNGVLSWTSVLASGAGITNHLLRRRQESVETTDLATIQYTAGTTGTPKGVELTHENVVQNAMAVGDCMRLGRGDRVCVAVSFARPLGSVVGALGSLGRGAALIVPSEHFDAGSMLAVVAAERCTALVAETRMLVSALRHPDVLRTDVGSLRTGVMLGAPCPAGLMPEIVARLHLPELTVAYGQAETTAVVTQSRTGDSLELRADTVGRALPDVEVKIVDPKTGVDLPIGTEGELCCRGYPVMRGYYKMPELTGTKLGANGWLRTGDLAVMDRFGDCCITGRLSVRSS